MEPILHHDLYGRIFSRSNSLLAPSTDFVFKENSVECVVTQFGSILTTIHYIPRLCMITKGVNQKGFLAV